MKFDHIGLMTKKKKENENYVEDTRVWVTNPKKHPFDVEWILLAKIYFPKPA